MSIEFCCRLMLLAFVLSGCGGGSDEVETKSEGKAPASANSDKSSSSVIAEVRDKPATGIERFKGPDTLGLPRVTFKLGEKNLSMEAPEGADVSVVSNGSRALIQRFDSEPNFDMRWSQDETREPIEETFERRRSFIEKFQEIEIRSEWIDAIFGVGKSRDGQDYYQVYMWKVCDGDRYYFTATADDQETAELCLRCAATLELSREISSRAKGLGEKDSVPLPQLNIPLPTID